MDHDADTEPQIVLSRARDHEWCSDCLKRSRRQHYSRLLIAAIDDVPVNLKNPYIELVIELDVETATKSHGEAGLVSMKVVDAKERRQLRTIDVEFLNGDAEECVPEGLECWTIFRIVFYLNAAKEILQGCIYRAVSQRPVELVFTQVK